MAGPSIRTDIVDVYVFHRCARDAIEFLQLHRSKGPVANTWQPVMGHVERNETAIDAALRELEEETDYHLKSGLLGLWQLEVVNTYFLAAQDAVMMSPCFGAEVDPHMEPVLDEVHDKARWVDHDQVDRLFMWPGQRQAVREVMREIIPLCSLTAPVLRIDLDHR